MLTAIVLALNDDIGWQMCDTNRRADLIYVLTARATGAVEVNSQVLVLQVDQLPAAQVLFDQARNLVIRDGALREFQPKVPSP